ncbi:uroporphyrinogen-III synthase [Pseudomonas sp. EpS/L25]|uniref:uroporphyrinogen-III synthase n=1 Tax=Pseudomonas sp. EpS/L25 TaxID=1749078 RepID=UPI000743BA84|nr:uroporphyrinogen-III synthase [Pseudomonas sp. EpS/L25]KUM39610.1 uroporphyrinogen-III synthase [Pseudomonas sp. EpS/L25]
MSAWRLLLTRPADENAPLAATLAATGIASASLPLLEIQPLPETPEQRSLWLDLDRYAAVLVVSKPAARLGLAALDRYWPQPPLQAWFAVGAATAAVLDDYGLPVHYPEREDSEGLLALPALADALQRPEPEVLLLRGEGGRDLLVDGLTARGARVEVLELYRRQCPEYAPGLILETLAAERLNAIMVSSGQGFAHLQACAGADWPAVRRYPLLVPSARVAELARASGCRRVIDCQGANAGAIAAALAQHHPD